LPGLEAFQKEFELVPVHHYIGGEGSGECEAGRKAMQDWVKVVCKSEPQEMLFRKAYRAFTKSRKYGRKRKRGEMNQPTDLGYQSSV
jgi:hypothetical protein